MKTMVISIRNTAGVRCREVVRFSEGPLWEVRLYTCGFSIGDPESSVDAALHVIACVFFRHVCQHSLQSGHVLCLKTLLQPL